MMTTLSKASIGAKNEDTMIAKITSEQLLKGRIKEFKCFYDITRIIEKPGITLDEIYQEVKNLLPENWQYPEITCAKITVDDKEFRTENYRETQWKQSSDITVHGERVGIIEVCYLEERPHIDEGPFLKEERLLIDAVAKRLGRFTEYKWMEEELNFKAQLLDAATDLIHVTDGDWNLLYVNEASCLSLGYSREELLGHNICEFLTPEDGKLLLAKPDERLGISEFTSEVTHIRKDKTMMPSEAHARMIKWGDKEVGLAVIRDITERKVKEKEYQNILHTTTDGFWIVDAQGRFLDVNEAYCALIGYSREELLNMSIADIEAIDTAEATAQHIQRIIKSGRDRFETCHRCKNGKVVDIEISTTYMGAEDGRLVVFVRDITERKQAEEALRESEERYRSLVNNISLGIFRSTPEPRGRFLEVNPAMERITGYSREELLHMDVSDLDLYSEERPRVLGDVVATMGVLTRELQVKKKDGEAITVSSAMVAVRNDVGQVVYFDGIVEDITERKRIEQRWWDSMSSFYKVVNNSADGIVIISSEGIVRFANSSAELLFDRKREDFQGEQFGFPITLGDTTEINIIHKEGEIVVAEMRVVETVWFDEIAYLATLRDVTERRQSEELFRSLCNGSPVGIYIVQNGKFQFVNPQFQIYTGYSQDELVGMDPLNLVLPADREVVRENALKMLKGEHPSPYEYRVANKAGEVRWVMETVASIKYQRKKAALGNYMDITEHKQSEEEQEKLRRQLQTKVSELEAFSYGVAHDLRSPLLSIEGLSRLLRTDMQNQKVEMVQEDIRLIESGVRKMQQLLNRTLEYSRAGQLVKLTKNVPFSKIIREVVAEFAEQVRSVGATVSVAKTFPKVYVDRIRIRQVLTNLIQNSIKYRDKTRPLKIEIGYWLAEDDVVFFVRDNGIGIDASEMEKVFGLFYRGTTDGEGSGAGLAIVQRIIEAHGGRIWVKNQSRKGTTMCFTLPQHSNTNKGDNNG
jgi:PAS domain S-box-containing protein